MRKLRRKYLLVADASTLLQMFNDSPSKYFLYPKQFGNRSFDDSMLASSNLFDLFFPFLAFVLPALVCNIQGAALSLSGNLSVDD